MVLDLIPEGGVFLDVGAHVGHYALRAAGKASKVIAIEPNADTFARLQHNLAINGITNCHCINVAAWDSTARLSLRKVHEQYERDGSNYAVADHQGGVWGARLDDALSTYPARPDRLDVVKIDTEGADIRAISGMTGLLARHRPVLFIEDHSEYGYYPQSELLTLLAEVGYEPERVMWGHSTYWIARPAPAPSTPAARF